MGFLIKVTDTSNDFEVQYIHELDISDLIDADIMLTPSSRDGDNNVVGPISGTVRFSTTLTQTQINDGEGYGLLEMAGVTPKNSDDEWLIKLLQWTAAHDDDEGSDTQLLLTCIGEFDEGYSQGGFSYPARENTDSYHARYFGYPNRGKSQSFNVDCKVDWQITGRTADKTTIKFQVHASDNSRWKANYKTEVIDVLRFSGISGYDENYGMYFEIRNGPITFSGDGMNSDVVADKFNDVLEEYFRNYPTSGNVGIKSVIIECVSGNQKHIYGYGVYEYADGTIVYGDGDFDIYRWIEWGENQYPIADGRWAANGENLTITIKKTYTEDHQVYSRPYTAQKPNEVKLTVTKTIANQNNYSANFFDLDEYDLYDTKFYLYASNSGGSPILDVDGNTAEMKISTHTTKNTTSYETNQIKLGAEWGGKTVYLEEVLSNKATGYKTQYQSGNRLPVTLPAAGETGKIPVVNEPVADPAILQIQKISTITGESEFIADVDLSDIQYTLSYLGDSKTNSAKTTWTFKTNSFGRIDFSDDSSDSLVNGPSLYTVDGEVYYPVGWYKVQEVSDVTNTKRANDKGLEISTIAYYVHFYLDSNGEQVREVYEENKLLETFKGTAQINATHTTTTPEGENWETFEFNKKDLYLTNGPQGDAELDGAVYQVFSDNKNRFGASGVEYPPDGGTKHLYTIRQSDGAVLVDGEEVYITISNGKGVCNYPLPKADENGYFYIVETQAPEGYTLDDTTKYYVDYSTNSVKPSERTSGSASVTVNGETETVAAGAAYDRPTRGAIEIYKSDEDNRIASLLFFLRR